MSKKQVRRPDAEAELQGLKDFQRATVDYIDDRLWGDDPVRRFLVADEVGLGKTLIARGVIAKSIEHLWDKVDRIDVVYICSNAQIARQNLARLRVGAELEGDESGATDEFADRLTLLAQKIDQLKGRKLNFVSFSPGTSFNVSESGGTARERVLLYWMLRSELPELKGRHWLRFFRGATQLKNFERQVNEFDRSTIPVETSRALVAQLRTDPGRGDHDSALDEIFATAEEFKYKNDGWWPEGPLSRRRYALVGAMRQMMARAAVHALEPDIIVLDEFQRFTSLLHDDNPGAELARALFDHGEAKLLLLSATPFKMYTLPDEAEGEDHYDNFVQTINFLAGPERAERVKHSLADLRRGLMSGEREQAAAARDVVQAELRRVMVRTERLASTPDRDGMVVEKELDGLALAPQDVSDYRFLSKVAKALRQQDMLEYWRSSPYVLELMDGYVVKKELESAGAQSAEVKQAIRQSPRSLTKRTVNRYEELEPGNPKMRALTHDVLDRGAHRLAWIPPSMPYYETTGAYADPELRDFTKRLVFSAWNVVPKAISSVLSYEAERRLRELSGTTDRAYDATRQRGLLAFNRSDGRLSGMPVLAMIYPCAALAAAGDPLYVARRLRAPLPLPRETMVAEIRNEIERHLEALPAGPESGPADDSWYWAAPVLLDQITMDLAPSEAVTFDYGEEWGEGDNESRFQEHLSRAAAVSAEELGRRPDDLADVLTNMALGGFGVSALRALSRVAGGDEYLRDPKVRNEASTISWALRNHANQPEMMALIRGASEDTAYWKDVLTYSVDAGLTSVLDEYAHVLNESLGVNLKDAVTKSKAIATEMSAALGMRASVNKVTDLSLNRSGDLHLDTFTLRNHFAVRFGRGVTEDQAVAREGQVRQSFNSPFWPFVLSSTSVGQEGLDFHQYSHAIVHWNLPSNPVDLEQREGRVHRYKGHAVRRNVALKYGARQEVLDAKDPWQAAFELADADRPAGQSMVYPYWVFPLDGGHRIERYVPALPLSKEAHSYRRLMRTVGAYRLVIGQPRQEDLLRYLGDDAEQLSDLLIDLSPRA
ncbi:C-terminal helicase domain-containing protein [Nocardioides ganghwensis]|uniref:Helicase n=1 Tax=Nocardioides ganghwensis TaxID=252230 RepID=A0A4Q2SBY4_9ACTN|nr:helicase-related protein [Nocardioides ganghwensis]MBD3947558.1 DEAD/DEAH box helicase [Nocardioides ganghwensis]RYB99422.1 helicase [Nocardioides ganghwensis]